MGLSQSTVQRRVNELEKRIGRQSIPAIRAGYRLTEFGEAILPYAERVEAAVGDLELRVKDTARELAGVIRVTCPEPIVYRLTKSALIDRFHARHPGLRVEFVTSDRYLDSVEG